MFSKKRIRYVDFKEINKHLNYCYDYRRVNLRPKNDFEQFKLEAFIEDKLRYFELSYKYAGDACTYIFDKANGDTDDHQQITGLQAYSVLCRYAKINKVITDKCDAPFSAKGILWRNKKYEGKRVDAICYDMNSAYSYAMIQPMPDTSVPPMQKEIEDGEIGFYSTGDRQTSGYSEYVFKLIESPFKRFVETYYKRKQKAKTRAEKRRAKEYLNFCVGFLQHRDPYTRAQIVGLANDRIMDLMDENTIYCNTDCIVSLKERPDLELGDNIGQWKVEHRDKFAFVGFNYQWGLDTPSIRGKSKTDFYKGWDILKDQLPDCGNKFKFNPVKGVIEKV